ncbi:hypothetical protein J7I94_34570 [Streptomyces sp. ISL-12]|uniref:hypothetical protein n=1 Tax=Streptomyces sp. ISL-12 TaxID=2819177 RepID=UPI001BE981FF|nr:hypothetical protein [Streptomyces sp. ISL-12]MBT2415597.1 hypothetical protein [Streptomyces sp. ISL-12]
MTCSGASSDLKVSATECVGTVQTKDKGSLETVIKGDDVWALDSGLADGFDAEIGSDRLFADAWPHGTEDNALMKSLASWCHREQFTEPDTLGGTDSEVTEGKVTTVDGRQAVPLVTTANGESVTWYAATTGEPLLVRQDSTRDDMPEGVFSGFGTTVGAAKPSGTVQEAPEE